MIDQRATDANAGEPAGRVAAAGMWRSVICGKEWVPSWMLPNRQADD